MYRILSLVSFLLLLLLCSLLSIEEKTSNDMLFVKSKSNYDNENKQTWPQCTTATIMQQQKIRPRMAGENRCIQTSHHHANNAHHSSTSPVDVCLICQHQPRHHSMRQNYFQFRCAEYQRVNKLSDGPYRFIRKQSNTVSPHPGQYYEQQINRMDSTPADVQQYFRYRYANNQPPSSSSVFTNQHLVIPCYSRIANQSNENQYSRYRNSQCSLASPRKASAVNTHSKLHQKCRALMYDAKVQRFPVPDDRVNWNSSFPDYSPIEYTTTKIKSNPKADPSDPSKIDKFNEIDNKIDRRSFTGRYDIDPETYRPRNPMGRTGITGRGRLYYWGPNHAGDPVVTRWCRNPNGTIVQKRVNAHNQLKPVLEFVAIRRRDTKDWALPGGMVDPGEHISSTIKREFQEEAMRDGIDPECANRLFANGYKLFESYVDDPRNTDNAWMESVAMHFHDDTGELTQYIRLQAGDDAEKAVWCPIDRSLSLYASHGDFVKAAVERLGAFW